ncbi:MAG: hypothetical protein HYT98_04390 [Candidatus Sungbacteria bacterium]|nr:hypothetical protein [Candidatus Sungbacteria bacterium]
MNIACIARDESGGRCRDDKVKNRRCARHEGVDEAPKPNDVLIKFQLNTALFQKAGRLGIRMVDRTDRRQAEIDESHRAESDSLGRDHFVYRDRRGDSGTSVFNGKKGLERVTSAGLFKELETAGFLLQDIHCFQRPWEDKPRGTGFLVVGFKKSKEEILALPPEKEAEIVSFVAECLSKTWRRLTVFENPAKPDGLVRHTVNHLDMPLPEHVHPDYRLALGDGHWEARDIGTAVRSSRVIIVP